MAVSAFKMSAGQPRQELAGIEVLRFLCALAVLIWHYQHFFFGDVDSADMVSLRPMQPFYGFLQFAYEEGYWAVEVFWGISGFIFYWTYAQSIADRRIGIGEFVARRFSRLYPLHVCTLVLVALLEYFYFHAHGQGFVYNNNDFYSFIAHCFFASNWFKAQAFTFNGPIWSVSVEIVVYFAFFAVVRKVGPAPATALAACILSWVLDRANSAHISPFNGDIFKCAIMFFAGGVTQWLCRQRWALLASVCIGAVTVALAASGRMRVDFSTVLILTVCFVAVFARLGEWKTGSVLRRLAFLGNATYSSYLAHFPIQLAMVMTVDAIGCSRAIFFEPMMFVTYLALVIGVALAVYRLFELPAQHWIRDFAAGVVLPQGPLKKSP